MKDKKIIIATAFLAVLICLIITMLLFFAVTPKFLIILAFTIGVITGVCITALILYLANTIKSRKLPNEK
jgi:capsular polysaccharide biosynthesis protein